MSRTSPKTTRYTSLKENHEKNDSSSVHRRERKVEKGSALPEIFGHAFQKVTKRAATPNRQSARLNVYTDFYFRRTFLIKIVHSYAILGWLMQTQ